MLFPKHITHLTSTYLNRPDNISGTAKRLWSYFLHLHYHCIIFQFLRIAKLLECCCCVILMIHLILRDHPRNLLFDLIKSIIETVDAFHFLYTFWTLISMSTFFKLHISSCYQDQVWDWSCLNYTTNPILFLDYTRFSLIKVNFDTRVKGFDLNVWEKQVVQNTLNIPYKFILIFRVYE